MARHSAGRPVRQPFHDEPASVPKLKGNRVPGTGVRQATPGHPGDGEALTSTDVITKEQILVTEIEPAIEDDGMSPDFPLRPLT